LPQDGPGPRNHFKSTTRIRKTLNLQSHEPRTRPASGEATKTKNREQKTVEERRTTLGALCGDQHWESLVGQQKQRQAKIGQSGSQTSSTKNPKTYRKKEKPVAARTSWHVRSPQSTDPEGPHSMTKSAGDEIAMGQKIVRALDRRAACSSGEYEVGALLRGPRTGAAKPRKQKIRWHRRPRARKNENKQAATRGVKKTSRSGDIKKSAKRTAHKRCENCFFHYN
jgi:hypothetical protein